MSDETYDDERARNLVELLRALARRITELDKAEQLPGNAGELMRLIGDVRSELFHYEVRATYDTPEIADHRRIVRDSEIPSENKWDKKGWTPGEEDDREW